MADRLLPDPDVRLEPPLTRDMPCPNCEHASHSPYVCNSRDGVVRSRSALEGEDDDRDYDSSREPCPCRLVPIPGSP